MAVPQRVRDVLARSASANFVGRQTEIQLLLKTVLHQGVLVTWLHGVAGVGKSALLQEFTRQARAQGATVIGIDCRITEPSPQGFLAELQRALNRPVPNIEAAASELGELNRPLLILDSYERFGLLDLWIRQSFLPALSDRVRIVLGSRHPPEVGWRLPIEWQGILRAIPLAPLSHAESLEMLQRAGIHNPEAERIYRMTRGHPLALRLAVSARSDNPRVDFEAVAAQTVVQKLTQLYLAEVTDHGTRLAVEAASVVRRTTRSLLAAMLPGTGGQDQYDRLSNLSFVEPSREGLMLHEAVQDAVSSSLRSSDPHRFRSYRRAAWRQIRSEMQTADRQDVWRYTADMLYLLQAPFIRNAFFPTGSQELAVDAARVEDGPAILAVAEAHESSSAAEAIASWWRSAPESFHVFRDGTGTLAGFYIVADWRRSGLTIPQADPLARNWLRHIRENPVAKDETVVYVRRWLSASAGESPSAVQASCWLDIKRFYVQLRPHLRRCYISVSDPTPYAAATRQVGFQIVSDASVRFDGVPHHLAVLDFGPDSIDGWLPRLVAEELGLDHGGILDVEARELVLDERRTPLTALEFGVLRYLSQHEGKTVSRAELLQHVWGQTHDSGSNVVDVVIRALRRKLGDHASMLTTVRGLGYRLRSAPSG